MTSTITRNRDARRVTELRASSYGPAAEQRHEQAPARPLPLPPCPCSGRARIATGHVMLAVIGGVLLLATGNVCVQVTRARRAAHRAE